MTFKEKIEAYRQNNKNLLLKKEWTWKVKI